MLVWNLSLKGSIMYKRLSDGQVVDVVKWDGSYYTKRPEWLAKAKAEGTVSTFDGSILVAKGSYKQKLRGAAYLIWDGASVTIHNVESFASCFEEVSSRDTEQLGVIVIKRPEFFNYTKGYYPKISRQAEYYKTHPQRDPVVCSIKDGVISVEDTELLDSLLHAGKTEIGCIIYDADQQYSKIIIQYPNHKLEIINVVSFDSFTVKTKFAEYTLGSGWLWIEEQR